MSNQNNMNIRPVKCPELKTNIKVNPNTNDPAKAWDLLKDSVVKNEIERMKLDEPIYPNKVSLRILLFSTKNRFDPKIRLQVRFVCISDTHAVLDKMHHEIPAGDVLIHAGDFTSKGSIQDLKDFSTHLEKLNDKFAYKIVIAGNHELLFEPECARAK
jgi:hypothetical protein